MCWLTMEGTHWKAHGTYMNPRCIAKSVDVGGCGSHGNACDSIQSKNQSEAELNPLIEGLV